MPPFQDIDWVTTHGLIDYGSAIERMDSRVTAIHQGVARECVWLLEHPALYTAGTGTNWADLASHATLPVYETGRGGQLTYHGPGQRIAYVMLDVKARFDGDVRSFVSALETWIIRTLREFGIHGEVRDGRTGVWVVSEGPQGAAENKIAAIGIRVRHGISLHGISLNVSPNLAHYDGIIPCGISDHGVTSLTAMTHQAVPMDAVDSALAKAFRETFGGNLALTSRTAP